jgi:hypothetical protein
MSIRRDDLAAGDTASFASAIAKPLPKQIVAGGFRVITLQDAFLRRQSRPKTR